MPPKRKAASAPKKGGKVAKVEEPPTAVSAAKAALAKAPSFSKKSHKPDNYVPLINAEVVDDYDCMLNQTNIGHNNNKYYVIQLLKYCGQYYVWNRWGRVGEKGSNSMKHFHGDFASAENEFKKKFKDKTRNDWENRAKFKPSPGKYTLLEMGDDDEEVPSVAISKPTSSGAKFALSKLDGNTQMLMKLIFSTDMFENALAQYKIDTKKMPLGKLSKAQIAKGFDCLEEIEKAVNKNETRKLDDLTSQFYTLIPHDFGRARPPRISTLEQVREKMDMLLVLGDIEMAQEMKKGITKASESVALQPDPADANYDMLKCELKPLDPKTDEYKTLENYAKQTQARQIKKIMNIWRVARDGEDKRYTAHKDVKNRKLLWHGTNVAVVAAILKTGLRIMPHSGGRLGKGIYFASENGKSAGYVSCGPGNVGIMFLCEVALGKEHSETTNRCDLVAAPSGFDSVVGRGRTEPDPKCDKVLKFDGSEVVVPQGKPLVQSAWNSSGFWQSEYLIYKESQCRIRYLLQIQF